MDQQTQNLAVQALSNSPTFGIGVLALYAGLFVFLFATMWKIFAKAGQPGWAALVPIYNLIVLQKVARRSPWALLLYIIPLVNIYAICSTYNGLAKSFGKNVAFTLGLIFINPVFMALLAFGDAEYEPESTGPMPTQMPGVPPIKRAS